jgi:integration host factor subunit alpha
MALTKYYIAKQISKGLGLNRKESRSAVESLLETIKSALEYGDDVIIYGFGKFWIQKKQKRLGRNPITGEKKILRYRRVVKFKYSRRLKAKINSRK